MPSSRSLKRLRVLNVLLALFVGSFSASAAQRLLNLDYGAHQNPNFGIKTGPAAVGLASSDFWNLYSRDNDGYGGVHINGVLNNLQWSDKTPTSTVLEVNNAGGAWYTLNSDPMFLSYLYPGHGETITSTFTHLPAGPFDLYVYAHGQPPEENAVIEVRLGATSLGSKATSSATDWDAGGWGEDRQFVVFRNLTVPDGQSLTVLSKPGVANLAVINGIQLLYGDETPTSGPLQITAQPQSQTLTLGQPVTFAVSAVGTGELHYQWYHNGSPIQTAISSQFSISGASADDAGTYQVIVSDQQKILASDSATLTVNTPAAPGTQRLLNIDYGAHQNPNFSIKTGPAAVGSPGDVWNLYSRDDGSGGFRPNGTMANLVWSDNAPSTIDLSVTNAAGAWYTLNSDPMFLSYLYPLGGGPDIVSVLSDLPPGSYDFLIYAHGQPPLENGVIELLLGPTSYGARSTSSQANWDTPGWTEGNEYVRFSGVVVRGENVTIRCKPGLSGLSVINGLQVIYTPVSQKLEIVQQPVGQTVLAGETASVSVTALSSSPITYQWLKDGVAIPGATTAILTFANATPEQNGSYSVSVSDGITTILSSAAQLTVQPVAPASGKVINIDYGAHLNLGFSIKVGPAAVGSAGDVWNLYSRDNPDGSWRDGGTLSHLKWNTGEITPSGLIVSNAMGAWYTLDLDAMFLSYLYPESRSGAITSKITRLQSGKYDVYVYAHGLPASENASIEVTTDSHIYGTESTSSAANWDPPGWTEGDEYVVFRSVQIQAGETLTVISRGGISGLAVINGLQIVNLDSPPNPTTINDGIPDEWRLRYFSSIQDSNAAAISDPDNDGANNYQEFLDGTNPLVRETGGLPFRVETFAGSTQGNADGPLSIATFSNIGSVTLHNDGRLFVTQADVPGFSSSGPDGNNIRVIENGIVSTFAGSLEPGLIDGPRLQARFRGPSSIVFDSKGNAFVSDRINHRIRKIDLSGLVSTFAGSDAGFQDGIGSDAKFHSPIGMCIDPQDNLYVADFENYRIRKITPAAEVSTYAGTGQAGADNGFRTSATFASPHWIAIAPDGTLYIADWLNGRLRKISLAGQVSTVDSGRTYIESVGTDSAGNVYASVPPAFHRLIKYRPDGTIEWQMGNTLGYLDGPAALAEFKHYGPALILPDGNILISDGDNHVRKIVTAQHVDPLLTITPDSGAFYGRVDVSMRSRGSATINYTLDSSEPTPQSPSYSGPITVTNSARIQARLFVNGIPVSSIVSANIEIKPAGHLDLLNIDFGAHLNPNFSRKTGFAAIGNSPDDLWNLYSRDGANGQWLANNELSNLKWSDGRISSIHLAVQNAGGAWYTENSDPMFQSYLYPLGRTGNIQAQLTKLPPGTYDVLFYAHGLPPTENAVVSINANGRSVGPKSTSPSFDWDKPAWTEGSQYVLFSDVPVGADGIMTVISAPGVGGLAVINGIQLVLKSGSVPPFNPALVDWTFEEGHAGDIAALIKDSSGNAHDSTRIIGSPAFTLTAPAVAGLTSLRVGATGAAGFVSGPSFDLNLGTEFTVETLLQPLAPGTQKQSILIVQDAASGRFLYDLRYDPEIHAIRFVVIGLDGNTFTIGMPFPSDSLSHHVAVVSKGNEIVLYLDKVFAASGSCSVQGQTGPFQSASVWVGAHPGGEAISFHGVIDRVRLSSQALSADQFFETSKDANPLLIVRELANISTFPGERVAFYVLATGTQPLSYQWTFNGQLVPGANAPDLDIGNVQLQNAGSYTVTVTDPKGLQASSKAQLTVEIRDPGNLPAISRQPANVIVNPGQPITLSVEVQGPGPLTYQWQKNGAGITGATESTFTLPSASGEASGEYLVAISNPFGTVLSSRAFVSVVDTVAPTVLITSPSGPTENIQYTLAGTVSDNSTLLTIQWEREGQVIFSGPSSGGAFEFRDILLQLGTNHFTVRVSDQGGNSASATVEVVLKPNRTLSLPDGTVAQEGERFDLPVRLVSHGDVAAATFEVSYDTNYFTDVTFDWQNLPGGALGQADGSIPGKIRASLALSGQTLPAGTNILALLHIRLRSVPETLDSALTLTVLGVYSASGDPITSGTEVRSGTVTLLQRKIMADNNGNDRLDVSDASAILRMVTQIEPTHDWDIVANDLNHNNTIDAGDAIKVLRTVAHLDAQPVVKSSALHAAAVHAANASSATLSLVPDKMELHPGDHLVVRVTLGGVTNDLYGVSFKLSYPVTALRLQSAASLVTGPLPPASALSVWNVAPAQNDYSKQDGTLYAAFSSATSWPSKNGEVAVMTFLVTDGASLQNAWSMQLNQIEISDGLDVLSLDGSELPLEGRESAPPQIAGIRFDKVSGVFTFDLTGDTGTRFKVEVSENLSAWTDLGTVTVDSDRITITDRSPRSYRSRYYRATQVR
jgi:sugar lactone lactonase YvrE